MSIGHKKHFIGAVYPMTQEAFNNVIRQLEEHQDLLKETLFVINEVHHLLGGWEAIHELEEKIRGL